MKIDSCYGNGDILEACFKVEKQLQSLFNVQGPIFKVAIFTIPGSWYYNLEILPAEERFTELARLATVFLESSKHAAMDRDIFYMRRGY